MYGYIGWTWLSHAQWLCRAHGYQPQAPWLLLHCLLPNFLSVLLLGKQSFLASVDLVPKPWAATMFSFKGPALPFQAESLLRRKHAQPKSYLSQLMSWGKNSARGGGKGSWDFLFVSQESLSLGHWAREDCCVWTMFLLKHRVSLYLECKEENCERSNRLLRAFSGSHW